MLHCTRHLLAEGLAARTPLSGSGYLDLIQKMAVEHQLVTHLHRIYPEEEEKAEEIPPPSNFSEVALQRVAASQ